MRSRSLVALVVTFLSAPAFAQTTQPAAPPAPPAPSAPAPAATDAPPPPAPPPATPPATTAAPAAPPAAAPAAPPAAAPAPTPPAEEKKPEPPPVEHAIGPEVALGSSLRLGGSSTGNEVTERFGLSYAAGVYWGMSRLWSVGLQYSRSSAGTEQVSEAAGSNGVSTRRAIQAFLANLRIHPIRGKAGRVFVGIHGGLSHEKVEQSGSLLVTSGVQPRFVSFKCNASGSSSLAIGASLGGELELGGGFAMLTRFSFTANRLSDSVLEDGDGFGCAAGAGSTPVIDGRVGVAYRFDLGGAAAPVSVTTR